MHLFCAEKSFVNIVALRMALFKDSNGIYWWFRHDQKVFPWAQPRWSPLSGETPLDLARNYGTAKVVQLLEAVAWPHGRSSDSPPLQMLAPRPRLHHGPNEGRMLREFYVISASLENVHRMSTLKDAGCLCYLLLESAVFWYHVLGHCG